VKLRFGNEGATSANFLTQLLSPEQPVRTGGGQVTLASRAAQGLAPRPFTSTGAQSEVR
jgi:hypothetical protein